MLQTVVEADTTVRTRQPFRHRVHRGLSCETCHETGARHRTAQRWTAAECAACHHSPERDLTCTACHASRDRAGVRGVSVAMSAPSWPEPRARVLPFDHDRHDALPCADCHVQGVWLQPLDCTACHTNHHRAEADCTACHVSPDPAAHPPEVHVTCAGSGCHAPAVVDALVQRSRSACVVCHEPQRDHRPGQVCADCHALPAPSSPGGS